MGRHIERAESVSRIVNEHTNLLVDLPVDVESDWTALLTITGAKAGFSDRYDERGEVEVINYLMADVGNPGSVLRSVNGARENLRVSRQMVPRAGWECLNRLHLTATEATAGCAVRTRRMEVTEAIIGACQQLAGILAGTMSRDHAYRFWELGRLVERADMTTRVLDVRAGTLMSATTPATHPPADRSPYEDVRWLGVLRSVAAQNMYQRSSSTSVQGEGVVAFLLDDPDFPRSIAHCAEQIERTLTDLPTRTEPLSAIEVVRRSIAGRPEGALSAEQLHEQVERLQESLEMVHDAVRISYFSVAEVASTPDAASANV
ncbi:alpha-E domain-containing protein [soil metagenome]